MLHSGLNRTAMLYNAYNNMRDSCRISGFSCLDRNFYVSVKWADAGRGYGK